ncbi:glycosyltransferase family 4 protein [Enterococcus faecalis]|nr:glycosyltransferase family 4 protein [Enterococcus faecalis]
MLIIKNILLITQNFTPEIGSAANRITLISKYLNEKYKVTVLTIEPQYPTSELYENIYDWQEKNDDNLKIIRIRTSKKKSKRFLILRLSLYLEVFIQLLKVIKKDIGNEKYDFIFVSSPPLSIPLLGIYAKYKFQAKLILDVRDLWPETLKAINGFFFIIIRYISYPIERIIYKKSDTIIVNSEAFIPYIHDITGYGKDIVYIPNSLTREEFNHLKKNKKSDSIQIIYAGNLGVAQDLRVFLALAEYLKDNNKVSFILIGYGIYQNKIIDTIREKKLLNVKLLNPEPRKKTLKRMYESDIAYMGLENQTVFQTVTPGKLIDYMGTGLPVIGLTYGHSRKIIEEAKAGVVLNAEDGIDVWIKEVEKLIYFSDTRMFYGNNAREYAYEHFNWDNNKHLLRKVFENTDE